MATKKELQQWLDELLPRAGGVKLWRADSNRMMKGNIAGLPDDAWLLNGHLVLFELKSDNDFQSDKQIEFMIKIFTKGNRYLHYILLESLEQIEEVINVLRA